MLSRVRTESLAMSITYKRDSSTASGYATVGATQFDQVAENQVVERIQSRDYIVPVSLLAGFATTEPIDGDQILETIGGAVHTFQAAAFGSEPPWRWHDTERSAFRVHCKLVKVG